MKATIKLDKDLNAKAGDELVLDIDITVVPGRQRPLIDRVVLAMMPTPGTHAMPNLTSGEVQSAVDNCALISSTIFKCIEYRWIAKDKSGRPHRYHLTDGGIRRANELMGNL